LRCGRRRRCRRQGSPRSLNLLFAPRKHPTFSCVYRSATFSKGKPSPRHAGRRRYRQRCDQWPEVEYVKISGAQGPSQYTIHPRAGMSSDTAAYSALIFCASPCLHAEFPPFSRGGGNPLPTTTTKPRRHRGHREKSQPPLIPPLTKGE